MSSLLGSKNGVIAYVSSMLYGSLRSSFFCHAENGSYFIVYITQEFCQVTVYSSRCLELLCVLDVGSKMFCCGFGQSMAFEIFLKGENCSFNRLVLSRLTLTHFLIILWSIRLLSCNVFFRQLAPDSVRDKKITK